ncbi:plasmid mobilization protein [Pedobacter suwonensis]|nr:plasmid mobilization relaxosome protein MobC [Pedobacter suwonensis]
MGAEKTRNSFSLLDDIRMERKNKQVGRPFLKDGKRNKRLSVRFSEEEFIFILSLEKLLGLKRTDIIRKRVLEVNVALIFDGRSVLASIDQIGLELSRTGNNINQLAKYANILNKQRVLSPVIFTRYSKELDKHSLLLKNLNLEIKKILKLMGS